MRYTVGVTVSKEYPVRTDKVLDVLGNLAVVEEIEMPFRPLSAEEDDHFAAALAKYDALLVRSGVFDADMLARLPKLKVIVVHGAGYDQVDAKAAAEHGICVANAPGANANGVVELAVGLMLAASRQLADMTLAFKGEKNWNKAKLQGYELKGKTLGLFGGGRIGLGVAHIALALGMSVKIYDPYLKEDALDGGIELCDTLEEVLCTADVFSLHAPLTEQTRHIINVQTLALMRESAIIVNTSRGPLIDEKALCAALAAGKLRAAALDVFEDEPPAPESPLYTLENVVMTPHVGGSTAEALENVASLAAEGIRDYLETGKARFRVN